MTLFRVGEDDGARLRAHLRQPDERAGALRPDLAEGLRRLCEAALPELGLASAAVVLVSDDASAVAASAGGHGERLETLQFDLGEGPTLEAIASGRPVLEGDLGAATSRWPAYAPAAMATGASGVSSFPLALGALRFGALGLYTDVVRRLGEPELLEHLVFADVAIELLLDGSHDEPGVVPGSQLDFLAVRSEVYQAQGMVMVDLGVGLAEALDRMRAHAFAEDIDLNDLAIAIVRGRRLPHGDAQ